MEQERGRGGCSHRLSLWTDSCSTENISVPTVREMTRWVREQTMHQWSPNGQYEIEGPEVAASCWCGTNRDQCRRGAGGFCRESLVKRTARTVTPNGPPSCHAFSLKKLSTILSTISRTIFLLRASKRVRSLPGHGSLGVDAVFSETSLSRERTGLRVGVMRSPQGRMGLPRTRVY